MCPVMRRIASAPKGKEEDAVFKALDASGLMVDVKTTKVDLGDGLRDFRFDPGDLIRKIAERGRIQNIIGEPWETCNLHACSSNLLSYHPRCILWVFKLNLDMLELGYVDSMRPSCTPWLLG